MPLASEQGTGEYLSRVFLKEAPDRWTTIDELSRSQPLKITSKNRNRELVLFFRRENRIIKQIIYQIRSTPSSPRKVLSQVIVKPEEKTVTFQSLTSKESEEEKKISTVTYDFDEDIKKREIRDLNGNLISSKKVNAEESSELDRTQHSNTSALVSKGPRDDYARDVLRDDFALDVLETNNSELLIVSVTALLNYRKLFSIKTSLQKGVDPSKYNLSPHLMSIEAIKNKDESKPFSAFDPDGLLGEWTVDWGNGEEEVLSNEETEKKRKEPHVKSSKDGFTSKYDMDINIYDRIDPNDDFRQVSLYRAELEVQVTDNSGKSLDAQLYMDGNYKDNTGWDGKYKLSKLRSGSYTIRLKKEGYNSDGISINLSPGEEEEITLTLEEQNKPPSASYTFSPSNPKTNQAVMFNSASSDPDGTIDDYSWTFDDDSTSSSKNPTHTYTEPGTYEVELTVTDNNGATDSTTRQVKVENRQPTAKFTYSPEQPKLGQQITFNAATSSDPDGKIETYKWDLTGDGETNKTGSEVTYTYKEEGTYEVKLTVTDDYGDNSSTNQEITVTQQQKEEVTIDEKHALVAGVTEYEYHGLNNLNFPAEDARAFYNLLIEEGGFNEENVTLLTNEEATTYRFDKELRRLATETESDDLAVIYYSGHGVQGKDAKPKDEEDGYDEYYVTHGTDPTDSDTIYETAYRDDIFANSVSNIPSDQVAIFLDSCYAGGATKTVKGYTLEGQKDFPTKNDVFSDFDDLEGMALFAASKEDQRSYEPNTEELKEQLGHGVFTYYLLQGLRGEADTDNDGTITIDELRSYVAPNVEEFTEENFPTPQTPKVKGAISAPLVQKEGKLEGEVKYVKGSGKDKAEKGEYVVIDLGEEDGVKAGDEFKVFLTTKGVGVFEKVCTRI
ncbi:PKD domain-containing protein, partial [Candidatus Bipolaricaulota bacterium]|nr:PKD domain-containing protein [Candidatus Bipolaricaulota bacterium]